MKTFSAILTLSLLLGSPSLFGAVPDVLVDTKATPDSPLTLRQIYTRGKNNYSAAAALSVTNLSADAALAAELKAQASASTHLSELSLKRICAIESQCSKVLAYQKASYKGFFQMSDAACQDVKIPFAEIKDPTTWKKGCEAGRKFLDLNWNRLTQSGATLTDGTKETLTLLYLTHQLGAGGGPALFKDLNGGTSASKKADAAMLANIPPHATTAMTAGDHAITELEFYAYWVGSIDAVIASFP